MSDKSVTTLAGELMEVDSFGNVRLMENGKPNPYRLPCRVLALGERESEEWRGLKWRVA